uniref:ATP synthase subunit a n=1 Tax=Pristurus rupestris rupestris TaxID=1530261 RepID=A0A343SA21_9SAUR|nr:ATP synthase F0 subunit 6 [Pristurus rupestris rupestris]
MLSLFDQFTPPHTLFTSLMTISLMFPILIPTPQSRLLADRITTLMAWCYTNFLKQVLSPTTKRPCPWMLPTITLIYLLVVINLLGLLPYTFTPSTQLSMDLGLAIPLWLTTITLGISTRPTTSLGHILPLGTPPPLIPVLIIIETASLLIRPLALGIRLTANMTAGHLLLQLVSTATISLYSLMPLAACLTTIMLAVLTLLELAVALIQAYVFTLLFTLYLEENA